MPQKDVGEMKRMNNERRVTMTATDWNSLSWVVYSQIKYTQRIHVNMVLFLFHLYFYFYFLFLS